MHMSEQQYINLLVALEDGLAQGALNAQEARERSAVWNRYRIHQQITPSPLLTIHHCLRRRIIFDILLRCAEGRQESTAVDRDG